MEISSVQDYISAIERLGFKYTIEQLTPHGRRLKTPRFIFRGHSNHEKYKVIPGILRYSVLQYSPLVEYNILSNFIIDSCRYLRDVPTGDILSWLEIAQHFGVPTRLLDFTSNPLVALYFACESKSEANASVWMVNTSAYNMIFSFDRANYAAGAERIANQIIRDEIVEFDSYDATSHSDPRKYSQYPLIYQPHYREERMSQQSSMFMLWGADRRALTDMIQEEYFMNDSDDGQNGKCGIIGNLIIPFEKKEKLLSQLDLCGINQKVIYPGLEGVGRYIKNSVDFSVRR